MPCRSFGWSASHTAADRSEEIGCLGSPKAGTALAVLSGDELKLVYPQEGAEPARYDHLRFDHFFLQPMDGPDRERNTREAVAYCLAHPQWRLSLQIHKLLGIP